MLCFDDCRAWTVLVQTYKNILGGLEPLSSSPKYGLGREIFFFFSVIIRISAQQCFDYTSFCITLS